MNVLALKTKHIQLISLLLFYISSHAGQYKEMSYLELKNTITYTQEHFHSIGKVNSIIIIEKVLTASEKFYNNKEYYLKALSYNFLGEINYSNKEYTKALENYKIAELFLNKLKNVPELKLKIHNNIASVYIHGFNKPGIALKKIKNIYAESKDLNEHTKNVLALTMANIYINTKHYKKASHLLKKCKTYFSSSEEHNSELATTYTSYAEYYYRKKSYKNTTLYYEKAADIAEKNKLFRQAMTIYKKYETFLAKTGNERKAYKILKKYTKHHQTALNTERLESEDYKDKLIASEEKNTLEVEKAEHSQTISLITIGLLLLCLILFCFFIYNHRKTKILGKYLELRNKQLKIAKDKSDKLAAVKTKFISTVSHELRTPLYGVVGLSSILMDRIKDEENHKFIKLMKFSADHLLNLINDVLQVTRMESYEITLDKASFNIKNLADDIKNSFEYQADKNGNVLNLNFDSDIPEALIGDSVRLSQIFINLISNANKFTKNGNISLNFKNPKVTEDAVDITFEIKDDGRGIPLDKQKIIFDKFSQADSKDHTNGTGLGLHIVQNLVNIHGGEIKIESTPGKGSNFYFTISLEIDKNKSNTSTNSTKTFVPISNTKDYKILIVEDNKINQIVTKNVLKKKNYQSDIAADGLIAIDMVKENDYDLILMDLNMPNMGGVESTKHIREFNSHIPIIALTASDAAETVKTILHPDSGFNDFLRKPYKNEEFFEKIETHLNCKISKAS